MVIDNTKMVIDKKGVSSAPESSPEIRAKINTIATELYDDSYKKLCVSNDRVFAALMAFQWIFSIVLAVVVSPRTWLGAYSQTHIHVWTAILLGGALSSLPIYLGIKQPGAVANRYINVVAQGLYSALLIHLTGGRIETHFHVFGSLAFFAFYRDLRVLLAGTVVIAGDHMVRGIFFPESAFGVFDATNWRWLEHAGWVVFEDLFLGYSILWSQREMRIVAEKQAEVQIYNEIIEEQVRLRTHELSQERNSVKLLLDNAAQGFLAFDKMGIVALQTSQVAETIFGMSPGGKHVSVIFRQPESAWSEYLKILFDEALPFEDMVQICPKSVEVNDRIVELSYKAVRNEAGEITAVMIVATDVTEIRALGLQREQEQQAHRSLIKILGAKNYFVELLELMAGLEKAAPDELKARRMLHTLKGGFLSLECRAFATRCHDLETELQGHYSAEMLLKGLASLQSEVNLFLSQNDKLLGFKAGRKKTIPIEIESIEKILQQAANSKLPAPIFQAIEKLTERPVEECLGWLSDVFVGTSEKLDKMANPIVWTSNTSIWSEAYKSLFKALIHIAINSADHGIESPDERMNLGKPMAGSLKVDLTLVDDFYHLRFRDDGGGIDLERIKAKGRALGMTVGDTDEEIIDLLFHDGFSTKDQVTEISGRGVGLNATRSEVRRLGGDVKATNYPGQGFEVHLWFRREPHGGLSAAA